MAAAPKKSRKKKSGKWFWVASLLLVIGIYWLFQFINNDLIPKMSSFNKKTVAASELRTQVLKTLFYLGIAEDWVQRNGRELQIQIPKDLHTLVIYQKVAQVIEDAGGTITQGREDPRTGGLTFSYALNRKSIDKIRLIPNADLVRTAGKIAIVIDDFGYNRNATVEEFLNLPFTLTYAIIPGLPYSKKIANRLHQLGKPIIIHMPMEPMQGKVETDGYTLLTNLLPEQIRERMRLAIQEVPYAHGVNNHMGSLATTDSLLLTAAFAEIKKQGYFYIDSRTSPRSIAYELAKKAGIPALRNTLFLDAIDDSAHVAMKLNRLVEVAKRESYAIGIGHPKKNTLSALKEILPILQIQGFQFIKAEDLVQIPLTYRQ